jgi:hypothetical protein
MPLIIESGVGIGPGITISQSGMAAIGYIDVFGNNFASPGTLISRQNGLAYDSSDNLYAVGYVNDSNTTGIVAKFNASGTIQWQRTLGASLPSDTNWVGVDVDNSSNVYVVGYTSSDGSLNARDVQVAKYDTNGNLQWQKTLGTAGTLQQGLSAAVEASTGDFYIAGTFYASSGSQINRMLVLKYNTSGVLQWQRSMTPANAANDSSGNAIALDSAGNLYIVGTTPTSTSEGQGILVKYNSSGVLQWQVGLSIGSGGSTYSGIAIDSSDNIFATGIATTGGTTYGTVAKYNTSGALQWKKQIGTAGGSPALTGLSADSLGNVYATGIGGPGFSSYIVKYDTNGSVLWQRNLQAASHWVQNFSIAVDSSNNLVTGGYTREISGSVNNQMLMFKVPGDGTPVGTYAASGISFTYGASSLPTADLSSWSATTATMSNAQPSFSEATSTLTGATSAFTNSVTAIV